MAAARDGADYIFFGPVFATPSKTAFGAPQGLQQLGEVCSAVAVPVLAIGGISVDNASDCLAAGAAGIAAIRLFQETSDPASLIARFRSILCGVPNSPSG
jgi:thiamine-phosphate pyrophosphorylase